MRLKLKTYTKLIIIASFLISAGLVLFIAFNANTHLSNMSKNNSELYSAYRISELMKLFKSNLLTLENKQKGYLITGDPKFMEEYKLKERETKTYLESMEKYFSGKPEQKIFFKLKVLTYKKLMKAKDLNQGHSLAGFQQDSNVDETAFSSLTDIHSVIDEIDQSLNQTTKILIDNSIAYVNESRRWSALEVILGVIASFVALFLLIRDINIRNKLEEELRLAKKQADDNANLKEQFMANMSHEIRTPMNAILGFTDLLQKTGLDQTQSSYLGAIKTSGSNLLNIINDILDFSKIEAGKLMIEKISFNLASLIDSLHIMFAEKAKQKQIRFEVKTDQKIPQFIFGDPTRLTQILVNLVNNAIKFTSHGGVSLHCELKSIEHDVVQLVFRIKDTGIGIAPDKLDQVFERFNQGNKETTRKYGGTGLGLSIVKDLVELQNGDIRVKSKQNAGSEFIVTISYPVSYENMAVQHDNKQAGLPKIEGNDLTVLLAEDNELNQKLAAAYLKRFGLAVDIAENGVVALDKLKKKHYDLVLMDIQMPLLDGYHTAQKIRQELHLQIPIIAMTAHIMAGEKEKCIGFGMNDYISKPFKEIELYDIVRQYLQADNNSALVQSNSLPNGLHGDAKKVVDFAALDDMARGNKEFIKEMIDLFLEKNPEDIAEINAGIAQSDYQAIRAISHRMKTSVGFMGLQQLSAPLGEIELLAEEQNNMREISRLFNLIKTDCNAAILEFKELLHQL